MIEKSGVSVPACMTLVCLLCHPKRKTLLSWSGDFGFKIRHPTYHKKLLLRWRTEIFPIHIPDNACRNSRLAWYSVCGDDIIGILETAIFERRSFNGCPFV